MRGRRFQGQSHLRICSESFGDLYLHKLFPLLGSSGPQLLPAGAGEISMYKGKGNWQEAALRILLIVQAKDMAQKDWKGLSQF